jgi:hypothetical protein
MLFWTAEIDAPPMDRSNPHSLVLLRRYYMGQGL